MPNDPSLSLFTAALGLAAPWKVTDIDFDETAKRIDFQVGYGRGTHFACPACTASDQPVHDRRQRTWQHLHFFEHRAFIHAEVPRVRCAACGKAHSGQCFQGSAWKRAHAALRGHAGDPGHAYAGQHRGPNVQHR